MAAVAVGRCTSQFVEHTNLLHESRSSRYRCRKIFTVMNFPGASRLLTGVLTYPAHAKEETPMDSMIDSLFDQYERGGMTRRHLVQALAVLVLPERALAQDAAPAPTPIVRGLSVNHVALTVSDIQRSFSGSQEAGRLRTPVRVSIWTCPTGTSASIQSPKKRA
jgi:hypothetical protein